ncbi:MAG: DDE-type integrase/transposase/recombinase [Bacteroidota bacterium]
MALRASKAEWLEFLTNIGIPDEPAKTYASNFQQEEVSISLLKLISDEELNKTYGVTIGGHRLRLRHSVEQFREQTNADQSTSSTPVVRPLVRHQPPQLQENMNPSSFRAFERHWLAYKKLVGLPSNSFDSAAQLFSLTCSENSKIRKMISDHNPNHLNLSEQEYLEMVRNLLTSRASPETYRNKFFHMSQQPGESCQQWLQRLQEISPDCEFSFPCNQDSNIFHSFDETLIRSKFIMGMTNTEIKKDLLSKCSELLSLNDVYTHARRLEATSRDIHQSTSNIANISIQDSVLSSGEEECNRMSSYRKLQKAPKQTNSPRQAPARKVRKCDGCGSIHHGSADRSTKCPAWTKLCSKCGKRGHFAKVCRATEAADHANALIAFVDVKAKGENEIELSITPTSQNPPTGTIISAYPDTGATLSVAGPDLLQKLKLSRSCLKDTTKRILTATGEKIHCIGKFQAKLSVGGRSTLQDIYICTNIKRMFLSKSGCISLGIVHEHFPLPINHVPSPPSPTVPVKPKHLPYPPTEDNIPLLKKYLVTTFSSTCFNNDKNAYFPTMKGVPEAHIHLKPDAKPFFRATPNNIPHFWRDATKELLDQHVKRGIIAKTPIGTPTPWCAPMVITPKKSCTPSPKLRMTVDLQHLNSQCVRELHHVESPFKLASQVPPGMYKTLLDAVDGYQAIKLDKESQNLTTFITPWGPYHFLRVPAGLVDSGDKYTSRYDLVIQHIPRKVKCVDDTLLFDTDISSAFYHAFEYLQTCASNGIILNASKFQFCQKQIDFAGFTITENGIKPSKSTLRALEDFPTPKSITDIRSWFGLVRQVAYAHSVSEDLAPLRCLLKHGNGNKPKFIWNEQLQISFEKSKKHVVDSVANGIESFDPKLLTCLQCDWSQTGIGFLLFQKHCSCDPPEPIDPTMKFCCESGWKPVFAGSRFTNQAESNYSPTEGETLAVTWALRTSRLFTLGCPNLYIVTDHRPLLGILNSRDLGSVKNPRIRRLKEHTLDFDFQIKYCPGKLHAGADALSRYPTRGHDVISTISDVCESAMNSAVQHSICSIGAIPDSNDGNTHSAIITLDKVELECLKDTDYMTLHSLVTSGFPENRNDVPNCARLYWPLAQKGMLSTLGHIVLYQERIVIPTSIRSYVIKVLHAAHQGCTGMVSRATASVYWPGMRKEILSYHSNCRSCTEISPSQAREPIQTTPLPERPFQTLCTDIFQLNDRFYLVVVDRYSGFLHIFYSRTTPTNKFLEKNLRIIFKNYGRPEHLETDGGPQFQSSQFLQFLKNWNVSHRVSSPYYPQSNGRAELGVKTAKRMLREHTNSDGSLDNDEVAMALLQYHNTPMQQGCMSPAQLLFGRSLPDFLPVSPRMYQLHPYWAELSRKNQASRRAHQIKTAKRYNLATRKLPTLQAGQKVAVQNHVSKRWDRRGVILKVLPHRKYQLRLDDTGNTTFRNRRYLKHVPECRKTARSSYKSCDTKEFHQPATWPLGQEDGDDDMDILLQPQHTPTTLPTRTAQEAQHAPTTTLPTNTEQEAATTASPTQAGETTSQQTGAPHLRQKEPLSLRRLRPHNSAGLKEN